jgi:hypothetical protein
MEVIIMTKKETSKKLGIEMPMQNTKEHAYLATAFDEMKTMLGECRFEGNKNEPIVINGAELIPLSTPKWPTALSGQRDAQEVEANTEICFYNHVYEMTSRYEGSFRITNAVIRAKFVGDEESHTFSIEEHEKLLAHLYLGCIDGEESPQALLVDTRRIEPVFRELEEFSMLALTNGFHYRNYKEPRAFDEDLVLFTCFNKSRKLSWDTLASLKHGLCDPKTVYADGEKSTTLSKKKDMQFEFACRAFTIDDDGKVVLLD